MQKTNSVKDELIISMIQMNSIDDVDKNLNKIKALAESIKKTDVIVLPEMANYRHQAISNDYEEDLSGPTIQFFKQLAIQKSAHIITGSMIEASNTNKSYNTLVVINPDGEVIKTYRKMHLFDVDIESTQIKESKRFQAGGSPEIVTINGWKVGLSICFDLRFPELYRWYFNQGVEAVVIPSSFTYKTGERHWHILCRARAIENQMYVIAPNQTGIGAGNKPTYGHSIIVDPEGEIIGEMNDTEDGVVTQKINKLSIANTRTKMPVKPKLSGC